MEWIAVKDASVRPQSGSSDWSFVEVEEHDAVSVNRRPKPKEKYPAKLHARSVAQCLGQKDGLIYLPGLPTYVFEDSDQPVHFRQRRYFYYMSGVNFPGCIITYDIRRDLLFAWIPPPNTGSSVIFNGPSPTVNEVRCNYEFDGVSHVTAMNPYLADFAYRKSGIIYCLHPHQTPSAVSVQAMLPDGTSVVSAYPYDTMSLKPAMDTARVIKSPYEIKMIRKASAITAQAHTNVLRAIKTLENEAEIEAIFAGTCTSEQAKEQAYGIIAASGPNASTLHYIANSESLDGRELVCLDAGCEWNCYASDVTRTFPVSGKFSPEGKEIYNLVAKMQEECIKMVKPAANYRDIHLHAHKVATKGLMKLGLMKGSFDELYESGASTAFFPHGLGHYLGLECHDVGDGGNLLFSKGPKQMLWTEAFSQNMRPIDVLTNTAASILRANMVITVEPGIYFSRYALEEVYLKDVRYAKFINKNLLEKYYPIGGVRIEDDILVTENGFENLTTAPKGDAALKIINGDKENTIVDKKKGWFW